MKFAIHRFCLLLTVTLALPFWGVGGSTAVAQGQDPTLAAMILLYTDKAKKESVSYTHLTLPTILLV